MKFLLLIILISCQSAEKVSESFSFKELNENSKEKIIAPELFEASDKVKLAYYPYKTNKSKANVIFIHGGGAHSGAGYQTSAKNLSQKDGISTFLLDLRGHGRSGGNRGDSPSVEQVYRDIKLFIDFIKSNDPSIPLYLAGHSSGGGLILNYSSWTSKSDVDGYIFISPELGYKSETAREDVQIPFAKPRLWVFILSAFSGGNLFGNTVAVNLNYPKEVLESDTLLITTLSRNMAVALTPDNPTEQFKSLNRKVGLFVGEKDELFVPEKVISYFQLLNSSIKDKSKSEIIKEEKHLSIILKSDTIIKKFINQ